MTSAYTQLTPIRADANSGIPKHVDTRPEVGYDGPSMPWLIANQKLAHQIIATHQLGPQGNILDKNNLMILRQYASDASPSGVEQLFREQGLWDEQKGAVDQDKLKDSGSLIAHAIVNGGFDEESVDLLNAWFKSDAMQDELTV